MSSERSSQGAATVRSTVQVWDAIAERLEVFARAWEAANRPPKLADFLPNASDQLRGLLLVELIKFDLEARLQRGLDRTLEEYAREFPELIIPTDLLYEDYQLRRRLGKPTDPQDYYKRFPDRALELAKLLGVTAAVRSTSVSAARKVISVKAGDQLDDFDLITLLGQGQYGKVFLSRQRSMQRLVALKVSAAEGSEAQTLAQLDHPHIVHVYDQRILGKRGVQLVYMAYLPGGTLSDVLDYVVKVPIAERSGRTLLAAIDAVLVRRGEVPPHASTVRQQWPERDWPATVCAIGAKLASALDYAHRRGVLHRDVKPANVLLSADGEPQLADFNVGSCSKLDGAGPSALFGGSLAYMSLEHIEAFDPGHHRSPDTLDGRADVFSLAVTLWELATGSRPFGPEKVLPEWKDTLAVLAAQRVAGPTAGADSLPDGSVPGLRALLLRCLQADPAHRPKTAGELAQELELCLRPETRKLVRPEASRWRSFMLRHPLLVTYPLAVIPNVLASLFNISYNREIIDKWPDATTVFDKIILIVNGLFFPLGMIVFWLFFRPLSGQLLLSSHDSSKFHGLQSARRRCLRLGAIVAWICVACWSLAGLLWPIVLRLAAGPPNDSTSYFHILISLVVCGLIAAAYPYFLITYLSIAVFYPQLLDPHDFGSADRLSLHRIEREIGHYRSAATAVPLLAVGLLAFRGASNQVALSVLSVAGLAGVGLAFLLEGRTRAALAALADMPGSEGAD
jgi:serine/threonine protein kinase